MFDYLYTWILYDILGYSVSTQPAFMLEPFALLLTYIAMALLIYLIVYFTKWSIRFVSVLFPWQ